VDFEADEEFRVSGVEIRDAGRTDVSFRPIEESSNNSCACCIVIIHTRIPCYYILVVYCNIIVVINYSYHNLDNAFISSAIIIINEIITVFYRTLLYNL